MAELQQQIIFKESVSESQQSEAIIDSFFNSARQLWFPSVYFGIPRLLATFKRPAAAAKEKIREENSGDCLMVISITERKGKLAAKKATGRRNSGGKSNAHRYFRVSMFRILPPSLQSRREERHTHARASL